MLSVTISLQPREGFSSPCWVWEGYTDGYSYGIIRTKDKAFAAHRIVYESLMCRDITGLELHHKCNFRACVNPTHLEALTTSEHARRHSSLDINRQCKLHPTATMRITSYRGTITARCNTCRNLTNQRRIKLRKAEAKSRLS